jgi:outer membrane protein
MKKVIGILTFIVLFTGTQSVVAQTLKFGHINSQELITAMPEYTKAVSQLDSLSTTLQNDLELQNVEFNNKYDKYLKEQKTLTDLVRQTREQELTDMQTRINNFTTQATTTINEKQTALMTPISAKAQKAISDVGKENGFFYIFDLATQSLIYFDETKSVNVLPLAKAKLGIK